MLSPKLQKLCAELTHSAVAYSAYVGGGCIAQSHQVQLQNGRALFVKTLGRPTDMFVKERSGLLALEAGIRVPKVLYADEDCLVLEFLHSAPTGNFKDFAGALAKLHSQTAPRYGFETDNYIGVTVQPNPWMKDWGSFFWEHRLLFQMRLADKKGLTTPDLWQKFKELEKNYLAIVEGSLEAPSLLHGDLWMGNFMWLQENTVCLYDPAAYYGHREADVAMTQLFGCLPAEFYETYFELFPVQPGFEKRATLYNLYHILNHLNLFGSGYLTQALQMMATLA